MAVNNVDGPTFAGAALCPLLAGGFAMASGTGWLTVPCAVTASPVGFATLYVGRKLIYSILGVGLRFAPRKPRWYHEIVAALLLYPIFFFAPPACVFAAVCVTTYSTIYLADVARDAGGWAGFMSVSVTAFGSIGVTVAFYKWRRQVAAQYQRELLEKFPGVYRVLGVPTDARRAVRAEGVQIEVGDYGWEAEPLRCDGLTYLHGLTRKWGVAWYAGFQSEQIERIGSKPCSQYDADDDWAWSINRQCPYPIQSDKENDDLGFPYSTRSLVRGRFWFK